MDNQLLESIYQRYRNEIVLYLLGLSGDLQLAEDLAQDTFLKALLSLPPDAVRIRPWLYRVARNLLIDHLRRSERRNISFDAALSEASSSPGKTGFHFHMLSPAAPEDPALQDPLSLLIEGEEQRALYRELEQLDVRQREILILRHYTGLSQREIAELLGITAENVRVLAYRAKKKLREQRRIHDNNKGGRL